MRPGNESRERVLVLTPVGRDAQMVRQRIVADGMGCEICGDLESLLRGIASESGAAVVAQEALAFSGVGSLLAALEAQAPWSDIPVLLLAESRPRVRSRMGDLVLGSGLLERTNVTLLQRPLGIPLFLSSVRSAVRARRRQYQMRDLYLELERAMQLSDMFVSILGHDLRNPIGAIRLAGEAIVRFSAEPRALRSAGHIVRSANRMARMIEQLLDFARARQDDGIPLQLDRMRLGELCRHVLQELHAAHPEAEIRLTETGNLSGTWDADRLAQVVTNLVSNAIEHGSGHEPIRIELDGSGEPYVYLRVHNAGTVAPEVIPTLFEPFKESAAYAPKRRTGLGLGLFIAREIARAHGGELVMRSENDWTTFELSLPRDPRRILTPPSTPLTRC